MPADSKTIPRRDKIEDKHKWNPADIYPTEEDWEGSFLKAKLLCEKAPTYTGKLDSSADFLFECLEARTNLLHLTFDLYQYAHLQQDLDNRDSKFKEMSERAAMLSSEASAAFSFVEPELLTMEDEKLLALANRFPKTDLYDFYIKELVRSRKHVRSTEVEELLAQSAMMSRGPSTIFSMLDDADLKYSAVKDDDGADVQLTKQRFARIMESAGPDVRREAHLAFYGVYKDHVNTTAASLASSVNSDIFYSRARGYESTLHSALDANNIPVSVYHSLLDSTEADLAGMHKWTELRKKILKLDTIAPYDMIVGLFPDQDFDVPYDEAIEEVLAACEPLGKEYCVQLRKAFDERWVDVRETEGKTSGAFSWGNYRTHPFVLMNYNDTVDNMFTLAHEMGHAMHSYLSNRTQPYVKSQYSTFVAEVASTLNEGLLLQHLLKKLTDPKQKLFLLNRHIDNTFGTFFHQVMYARFELMIHEAVEKGAALSPDWMNEQWEELTKNFYGPTIEMDELTKYKWSRIPHFYRAYYVFQYATSYTASQAILDKFNAGEEGIIEKYLALLSSGGNDHPIEQLKKCGIDMTTADPTKATLKLFAQQVNEVEKLVR